MININKFFILLPVILLVGCDGVENTKDLKVQIEAKKSTVVGQVEPLPKFKENDQYSYQNINQKSPFQVTMISKKRPIKNNFTEVQPDENRVKEPLENYDIDKFKMVGTIRKGDQELEAIIDNGTGSYSFVKVGNYIGKNNGKIKKITIDSIELIEIVPNGSYRWLERPIIIRLTSEEEKNTITNQQ